jgi:hypothetical protein
MDVRTGEIVRIGDTASLHNNCLAYQLTGEVDLFENLFRSVHGGAQPRCWAQGDERALCFTIDEAVLTFFSRSLGDVHKDFAFGQRVQAAFAVLGGK